MSHVIGYLPGTYHLCGTTALVCRLRWPGRPPVDVYERTAHGWTRYHGGDICHSDVAALRDRLRPHGRPTLRPDTVEDSRIRLAVERLTDPRHVLAYAPLREQVRQYGTPGSVRGGIGQHVQPAVWRKARAILAARQARCEARQVAEAARNVQPGRIAAQVATRREERLQELAVAVAEILHAARPLYTSRRGQINRGWPSEEKRWDIYAKRTKYPCCWSNAGAWVDGDTIGVSDSRDNLIYVHRVRPGERTAEQVLGVVSQAALDRIGPAGDDDRVHIRTPLRVCRSREGLLITDHPTRPRVVQVVVRDSTTGRRHHLTVPPRFGMPLADGERPCDRVHAALAWTFGLRPDQYSPEIQA